jgi:hypothetical protein
MFGAQFFGATYFGPRFWGRGGDGEPPPSATSAEPVAVARIRRGRRRRILLPPLVENDVELQPTESAQATLAEPAHVVAIAPEEASPPRITPERLACLRKDDEILLEMA